MNKSDQIIVGHVFARGGSKGVPGKNLQRIGEESLLSLAIKQALASRFIDEVTLSTDDEQIAEEGRRAGAKVPFMRPAELANDTVSELLAWRHAITHRRERGESIDVFVSTPATAPLRHPEDVDRCIEALLESDADLVFTVRHAATNPYFNMVKLDEQGYASLMMSGEGGRVFRRQDAPTLYDIVPVAYAARPDYIMRAEHLLEGKIRVVEVAAERAVDIDTPHDLLVARALYEQVGWKPHAAR